MIVEAFCEIKKEWISAVSAGYGCKLVSPWIAPGMLIPVGKMPKEDTSLWWTVFEEGSGWSEDKRLPAHASQSNPALASFGGELHVVHRGGGSDESLWQALYNPGSGWGDDVELPRHASDAGPAVAVFNGKLYCVHKGNGDRNLWWTARTATGGWRCWWRSWGWAGWR